MEDILHWSGIPPTMLKLGSKCWWVARKLLWGFPLRMNTDVQETAMLPWQLNLKSSWGSFVPKPMVPPFLAHFWHRKKPYAESQCSKLDSKNGCLVAVNHLQVDKLTFSRIPTAWWAEHDSWCWKFHSNRLEASTSILSLSYCQVQWSIYSLYMIYLMPACLLL